MGEFKSVVWIVLLSIYMFIFVIVASVVDSTVISSDYLDVENISGDGFCDSPRYAIRPDGDEQTIPKTDERCIDTRGAISEDRCESIDGCVWGNETIFFFWTSSDETCTGTININNLTNETLNPLSLYNLCTLEYVIDDRELCYNLGCTWYDETTSDTDIVSSPVNLLKTLGTLFTFRYDFGLNSIFNGFLNFFLFWIPLLMLIGAVYFLAPFLH